MYWKIMELQLLTNGNRRPGDETLKTNCQGWAVRTFIAVVDKSGSFRLGGLENHALIKFLPSTRGSPLALEKNGSE